MIRFALACAVTVLGLTLVPSSAGAVDPTFADAGGIHVVSTQQLDARLWALSVSSPALGRAVRVRILLPDGYAASPTARYPVLYLFHGTSGGAPDWTTLGNAEATTAGKPLIVVMPDAGFDNDGGGWFTNWFDKTTKLGPSQWETFHVAQLVPWLDANLRTLADRAHRAIAGLSQGGFGAMSYAARHPDMFAIAASFSGAPEIDRDAYVIPFSTAVIEATASALDGVEPAAMFGSRTFHEINWQAHDPATLMENLRWTDMYLWTGDGIPGSLDSGTPDPGSMTIEGITHISTVLFETHLQQAGIASHYTDYGSGTHTWPYWSRDFQQFIGPLMTAFASPAPAPTTITYQSADAHWSQWGWSVAHTGGGFSTLSSANSGGFRAKLAGSLVVTTPPFYAPGSSHTVAVSRGSSSAMTHVSADAAGRLHISVHGGLVASTVTVLVSG